MKHFRTLSETSTDHTRNTQEGSINNPQFLAFLFRRICKRKQ